MKFMSHLCKFTCHCKTVKHRYSEKSMIICQFSIIQDFKNHQLCRAMRFQPVSSMPAWLHQCWMLDQWLMNIDDKLSGGNRFKDMALHNPKEKMSMSQITLPETNCHLNSSSLPKKQHQQQGTTWNSPQKNMAKWSGFLDCVENLFSKLFINWSPWSADSPTTSKNSPIITGCFFSPPGRVFNFISGSRIRGGSRWGVGLGFWVAVEWCCRWGCHRWLWNIETHNISGGDAWPIGGSWTCGTHVIKVGPCQICASLRSLRVVIQNVGLHQPTMVSQNMIPKTNVI